MGDSPLKVLTIDGGGMRGLYSAKLLETICKRFSQKFHTKEPDIGKSFDIICGTSTGAILACGLAFGVPISKIQNLYMECGSEIFPNPMPHNKFKLLKWAFKNRKRPAANVDILKEKLEENFATSTLGELYEDRSIALCIPTIDANTNQPRVLKTPHNNGKHRDNNYTLVDACLASASAPIFFPLSTRKIKNTSKSKRYFVDGGLWANNPILVGLIEALSIAEKNQSISILSVGTCDQSNSDPSKLKNPKWGVLDWGVGVGIVDMSINVQSSSYTYMAKFLSASLNNTGSDIRIARLKEQKKSPQQYGFLGLDRADEVAIETMVTLAESDADWNYSKAISPTPGNLKLLTEIFSDIKELKKRS
ncbi:CBASS cGAMP-activated phospholipase [Desulfospira joergensenii]|uniref:CBASS cGAMP-activated phospholipase n=1 Tax=Desulfospira joergensenii TaxID=53329 RepID=UPI0003B4DB59|nr:CBASS cGAMP-activated phospholipase [Desulfospira joergensenii]